MKKGELISKLLILLEDAHSVESADEYFVSARWPITEAIRKVILDVADKEEKTLEPQTNFDKWKAALKPEDLVFKETDPLGDPKTIWAVWNISGSACDSCPAREVCHEEHEKTGKSRICGQAFKKWANKEIKPKEETK